MENQRNAWKLPLVMGTARLLWLTWTNPVPCGQGSLGPRFYRCFSFQYQLHSWHLHFGIYTGDCVAGYLSDQLSRRLVFRGFLVLELDFPDGSDSKESVCSARDPGSIPGSERSPGEGKGYPLQYPCLGNPMDRGAWRATVHGVAIWLVTWVTSSPGNLCLRVSWF